MFCPEENNMRIALRYADDIMMYVNVKIIEV